MNNIVVRNCEERGYNGFDVAAGGQEVWESLVASEAFVEGETIFANGEHATLKVEAERLYERPNQLGRVLAQFAAFPCVRDADVLLYVADGMRVFTRMLGMITGKPVADTERVPGSDSRYDFMFSSPEDGILARTAERPLIAEDIVTTLGSIAGVRRLLKPSQDVHSLAMLLRGTVNPAYQAGLTDHYLLEREIPTDKDEFHRIFG